MKPLYHAHDENEFQRLKSGMEILLQNYQLMGLPEVADVHIRSIAANGKFIEITPNNVAKIDCVTRAPITRNDQKYEGQIVEARRDSVKIKIGEIEYTINYDFKK